MQKLLEKLKEYRILVIKNTYGPSDFIYIPQYRYKFRNWKNLVDKTMNFNQVKFYTYTECQDYLVSSKYDLDKFELKLQWIEAQYQKSTSPE